MSESGIYIIRNRIATKFYIGSTTDSKRRFRTHIHALKQGVHFNDHLQRAWNLYGPDAFDFYMAELVPKDELKTTWSDKHQSKVILPEQEWIDAHWNLGVLYNTSRLTGRGDQTGRKRTEQQRKNISDAVKGRAPWNKGTTGLQRAWNKGIKCGNNRSPEALRKLSETMKRIRAERFWSTSKKHAHPK